MPANIKPNKCSPLLSWDWLLPATEPGLHSAMFWAAVFGGIGLAAQVVAGCLNGWAHPDWPVGLPLRRRSRRWCLRNSSAPCSAGHCGSSANGRLAAQ